MCRNSWTSCLVQSAPKSSLFMGPVEPKKPERPGVSSMRERHVHLRSIIEGQYWAEAGSTARSNEPVRGILDSSDAVNALRVGTCL